MYGFVTLFLILFEQRFSCLFIRFILALTKKFEKLYLYYIYCENRALVNLVSFAFVLISQNFHSTVDIYEMQFNVMSSLKIRV